jgi:DNA polymerase theta
MEKGYQKVKAGIRVYDHLKKKLIKSGRALLEVISTKLATSSDSIDDYIRRTLLFYSIDWNELQEMVLSTLQELKKTGLIEESNGSEYSATFLGQAVVASSLAPEDGLFVHRELRKALQAFVMDGEMHVLYYFTPVQATHGNINWQIFRQEVERLDESNMRALEFVGLKPLVINKM